MFRLENVMQTPSGPALRIVFTATWVTLALITPGCGQYVLGNPELLEQDRDSIVLLDGPALFGLPPRHTEVEDLLPFREYLTGGSTALWLATLAISLPVLLAGVAMALTTLLLPARFAASNPLPEDHVSWMKQHGLALTFSVSSGPAILIAVLRFIYLQEQVFSNKYLVAVLVMVSLHSIQFVLLAAFEWRYRMRFVGLVQPSAVSTVLLWGACVALAIASNRSTEAKRLKELQLLYQNQTREAVTPKWFTIESVEEGKDGRTRALVRFRETEEQSSEVTEPHTVPNRNLHAVVVPKGMSLVKAIEEFAANPDAFAEPVFPRPAPVIDPVDDNEATNPFDDVEQPNSVWTEPDGKTRYIARQVVDDDFGLYSAELADFDFSLESFSKLSDGNKTRVLDRLSYLAGRYGELNRPAVIAGLLSVLWFVCLASIVFSWNSRDKKLNVNEL